MSIKTVTVFGASGRQGQAQVKRLLAAGYWVRAISRHPSIFATAEFAGSAVVAADYADPASLKRACAKADAIFFQAPQAERPDLILVFAKSVAESASQSGVQRVRCRRALDRVAAHGVHGQLVDGLCEASLGQGTQVSISAQVIAAL
jgi:uncharacterized protein YbjT (DUF2867 family)